MSATYSVGELEALMADLESDLVARKASLEGAAPRRIRSTVCAYANDLPRHARPGVIFVGVSSSGRPPALPITDRPLAQLAAVRTAGDIVPPLSLTVEERTLLGTEVAGVAVQPAASPPVRCKGRIWIRIGSRLAVASAQDERTLNKKCRSRDRRFATMPLPSSGIAGLDLRRFEQECRPLAVNASDLAEHDRTAAERLAATKMIVSVADPTPTSGGMLILGKRPQDFLPGAYILFLRIAGTELSNEVVGEGICKGSVADLIRRLEDKLASRNLPDVDLKPDAPEIHRSMFPLGALRQLVRNAVMHRTYAGANAPVRVLRFKDRIAIISPGGSYGTVTGQTFGRPGVVACRNPFLAEAMRVLGLVQGFGLGIQAAQSALRAAGHPELDFRAEPNWLHCAVRTRP